MLGALPGAGEVGFPYTGPMTPTLPTRAELDPRYTWDLESIFATPEAWETEFQAVQGELPGLGAFAGRLNEAGTLLAYLRAHEALFRRLLKLDGYASLQAAADQGDQVAAAREGRAQGLLARALAEVAYQDPELLALPEGTLARFIEAESDLAVYAYAFERLRERAPHVRSAEVEALFGRLREPFAGPATAQGSLVNADLTFAPARGGDGQKHEVSNGTIGALLADPDRALRQSAHAAYADGFLAHKNTLANLLISSVRQTAFEARERGYANTREAVLTPQGLPVAALETVVGVFEENLSTWHRYWRARRAALGVETLRSWDVFAPLAPGAVPVPYPEALEMVLAGLRPLGEAYLEPLERGLRQERWVDVYPNRGKTSGAFSGGAPGTRPFILLNYTPDLTGMSVLAHELGHSLHSHFTWQAQPLAYGEYGMTVAETASNFNQALVRAHLLASHPARDFELAMLDEAFANFHRYFFIMPTLARFELRLHRAVESGEGLSADVLGGWMLDLFREGYGGEVEVAGEDGARVGVTWAQFSHLYAPFYVHQYASGISAATALAGGVLSGDEGARDNYLAFLRAGDSLPQLDALKLAGVDLTTPEPMRRAFAQVGRLVDRLEALTTDGT